MKIVAINSSSRVNGNTEKVMRLLEKYLKDAAGFNNIDMDFEYIALSKVDIKTCKGCRTCFDKGEDRCPLKDGFQELNEKLLKADAVILSSPVYVEDVNGVMKNWIDRMAFYCHRPAFSGKIALLYTTSGVYSSGHSLRTMSAALSTWGFYIAAMHKFRMGGLMQSEVVETTKGKEIKALADKLIKSYVKLQNFKPSFYSLMVFKVQQKCWQKPSYQEEDAYDYNYWAKKGWVEPGCNYYIKHKGNPIKIKIARMIGEIVALFFV